MIIDLNVFSSLEREDRAEILCDISLFQRFIRTVRPLSIITKSALKRISSNERAANELHGKFPSADHQRRLS
jgi:hypothetical protein